MPTGTRAAGPAGRSARAKCRVWVPQHVWRCHREIRPTRERAGRLLLPHPWGMGAGAAVGAVFADFHFAVRINSFQIAWACSSELLNGLSVPRDLRYVMFVIALDMFHLRTGGAVLSESCGELSSGPLATIPVRSLFIVDSRPRPVNRQFRIGKSKIGRSRRIPRQKHHCGPPNPRFRPPKRGCPTPNGNSPPRRLFCRLFHPSSIQRRGVHAQARILESMIGGLACKFFGTYQLWRVACRFSP